MGAALLLKESRSIYCLPPGEVPLQFFWLQGTNNYSLFLHCKCLHLDEDCNTNKSCRAIAGIQLLVAGIQLLIAGVQLFVVICTAGVQLITWTLLKVVIYIHSVHLNCSLYLDFSLCIIALANAVISFTEILVNNMQKSLIK